MIFQLATKPAQEEKMNEFQAHDPYLDKQKSARKAAANWNVRACSVP